MGKRYSFFLAVVLFTLTISVLVFYYGNSIFNIHSDILIHPTGSIPGIHPEIQNTFTWIIIQLILILTAAHIFGSLARKVKQPAVIGEMIAGILIGPSLLSSIFPDITDLLFPAHSLKMLENISQLGLMLFMFIVGVESGKHKLGGNIKAALLISQSGILIPFSLGLICSFYLFADYAPKDTHFYSFATFLGISMSITAFPVLARIIKERRPVLSKLGALILTCAAIDDITAWCLLALGVSLHTAQGPMKFITTVILTIVYIIFIIFLVKPILFRIFSRFNGKTFSSSIPIMLSLLLLFLSSLATDVIGIHLLFGAFLAGMIIPDIKDLKPRIIVHLDDICRILFLPVFFAISGLRTEINSLDSLEEWLVFFLLLIIAIVGKLFGCTFAARVSDMPWRESIVVGVLMNTRGLMELIVLNIGYSLGIISIEIFTMMVLVAIVTTLMTGFLLDILKSKEI